MTKRVIVTNKLAMALLTRGPDNRDATRRTTRMNIERSEY